MLTSNFNNSFVLKHFNLDSPLKNDYPYGLEFYFIVYVWRGAANFVSAERSIHVESGDFFYVPRGLPYHSYWYQGSGATFDSYGFTFLPSLEPKNYPMQKVKGDEESMRLLRLLSRDLRIHCTSVGLLYQLLGTLLPHMESTEDTRKYLIVNQAENIMRLNPKLRASETAQQCMVSESTLYSAFRVIRGCTPVDAKNKILVETALEYLRMSDQSIEEIAHLLHFNSIGYFRKVFSGFVGMTPVQARRRLKAGDAIAILHTNGIL